MKVTYNKSTKIEEETNPNSTGVEEYKRIFESAGQPDQLKNYDSSVTTESLYFITKNFQTLQERFKQEDGEKTVSVKDLFGLSDFDNVTYLQITLSDVTVLDTTTSDKRIDARAEILLNSGANNINIVTNCFEIINGDLSGIEDISITVNSAENPFQDGDTQNLTIILGRK